MEVNTPEIVEEKVETFKEDKKKIVVIIVVVVVVVITFVVAGIISLLSGTEKSDEAREKGYGSPANTEVINPQATQKMVVVIPEVSRDSILRSVDSGQSFDNYFRIATTSKLGPVDVLGITFHPKIENELFVSTYDDGIFLNQAEKILWDQIPFPPKKIYSFILDKKDPDNRSFASGITSENGRIFRTVDGGVEWQVVYAEPGSKTYVSALTQDPNNVDIILAGTSAGTLVRSADGGDTWKNIGQKISGKITRFAHDGQKASFVYLLVHGGKIYHSFDAGATWLNWEEEKQKEIKSLSARASELSRAGNRDGSRYIKEQITALQTRNKTEKIPSGIISITADPSASGVLYASLSKGLYRSTDYGKYWKQINIIESAEKFPILSVAINPKDSNEISFVAGSSFYRSVNYGSTWSITPLDKTRNASIVTYDPSDPTIIYIGLSSKK